MQHNRIGFDGIAGLTAAGKVFHGSGVAAGVALPIVSSTSPLCILWNPAGSNVNLTLLKVLIGFVSSASPVAGDFAFGFQAGVGAAAGTGAPITAFTAATAPAAANGLLGAGAASLAKFGIAATFTSAPTLLRTMAAHQGSAASTVPAVMPMIFEDVEGSIIIPPGSAFVLGTSVASMAVTAVPSLVWAEF